MTTEFQAYQTAVHTFRDRYFALPGDMRNATDFWGAAASGVTCKTTASIGTETCNGDGNGIMIADASQSNEIYRFWQQLANAGLVEGSYNGIAGTLGNDDSTIGVNVPVSKLSNTGWSVFNTDNETTETTSNAFRINFSNHFIWGKDPNNMGSGGGLTRGDAISPEEAWGIDKKIDDGLPAHGKVIAEQWADCTEAADNTPASFDASYNLDDTGAHCSFRFKDAF